MPDRLREFIVQQRSPNSSAASVVRLFTDPLATDRIVARTVPVEETDLASKTAQLIMGQPRKALVAQANQTPESVRALLEGE